METTTATATAPDTSTRLVYAFYTDPIAFPELTPREREVAIGVCRGLTGHEIAASLDFSIKTYDTHRGHILKKLGLRNNIELVLLAVKRGYVSAKVTVNTEA